MRRDYFKGLFVLFCFIIISIVKLKKKKRNSFELVFFLFRIKKKRKEKERILLVYFRFLCLASTIVFPSPSGVYSLCAEWRALPKCAYFRAQNCRLKLDVTASSRVRFRIRLQQRERATKLS